MKLFKIMEEERQFLNGNYPLKPEKLTVKLGRASSQSWHMLVGLELSILYA